MGDVVLVLDADDVGHLLCFLELHLGDGAEADVADEALLLEFEEGGERCLEGGVGGEDGRTEAEVDDGEGVEAEVAEVVVDGAGELLCGDGGEPGGVAAAAGADLGDEEEVFGIGVESFLDELVGDVRAVEVAGVDVVDAEADGLAKHGKGGGVIARRTPDVRAGELHGAVAEAVDGGRGAGKGEAAAEFGLGGH